MASRPRGRPPLGSLIGQDAAREIADMRDWWEREIQGGGNLPNDPFTKFGPRTFRWVKCSANSVCSSYPAQPANTFPIIFGELDFDDTSCGFQSRTFIPYDPSEDRVAHDAGDNYHHEGEIAMVMMSHGKWYFISRELCNIWYTAELTERMCPDNRGAVGLTNVVPIERPEPPATTARITAADNYFGRAARNHAKVLVVRIANNAAGSGAGSGCEDVFYVVTPEAVCRDIPVTGEPCSGSGADEGKFLSRAACESGSGAQTGSGSGDGCEPIKGWVMPDVAIETCSEEPELVNQLELEMFDSIANMDMTGCPEWVNFTFCSFASCTGETTEAADCEPCAGSGSGS